MLISEAYAQSTTTATTAAESVELAGLADAPTPMQGIMSQMGLLLILVVLFYVLLIMPQQRRLKEHSDMLSKLKKGDRVVTGGGLIGKVDRIVDDKEVVIDLGEGLKVTALRSMIQGKTDLKSAANDSKKSSKDKNKDNKEA